MPTLEASGTQTATVTTEHTLATDASNKTFVLGVDTNEMVAGDVLELRIYTKVLTGGTSRLAYYAAYSNIQGAPNKYSPPIVSMYEIIVTLEQAEGTSRDFQWGLFSF